ncbi:MAG: hypothetical protein RL758_1647, partial [Pseudomonadota bacterium]
MIERIIPFAPAHTWPLHGVAASRS